MAFEKVKEPSDDTLMPRKIKIKCKCIISWTTLVDRNLRFSVLITWTVFRKHDQHDISKYISLLFERMRSMQIIIVYID